MSETTTSDEPVTGPIDPVPPAPPPAEVAEVPPHSHPTSRLNKVLAWVGIIAGSLLIASIIFGTGFRIGLQVGSHGGGMGHHHQHGNGQMMERGGPGGGGPGGGGPMWRPGGPDFVFPPPGFFPGFPGFPGGPGGPGGPGQGGQNGPGQPPTAVPTPPGR